MDVTNRFVLDFAREYSLHHPGAKILDYGCGAGQVVTAGLEAGLDILGADVFYGGSAARADVEATGLLGASIHEIRDGRLPFSCSMFDLVTNNQVMEHIENLDAVLGEIGRVLKPGGTVLSIFPSRDVFREGHIGIPFSHWFAKGSKLRFYYTWALRAAGLGTWKQQAPTCRQWTVDKLGWIDKYTYYRRRSEVFSTYNRHFTNELREPDYIRYRLKSKGRFNVARLLDLPLVPTIAAAIFRKLAFLVVVSSRAPK